MEQILTKAIEGGYPWNGKIECVEYGVVFYTDPEGGELTRSVSSIVIDPDFWRCLGKAMGWGNNKMFDIPVTDQHGIWYERGHHATELQHRTNEWEYRWHLFIDHLASGGDAESFFKKLIK